MIKNESVELFFDIQKKCSLVVERQIDFFLVVSAIFNNGEQDDEYASAHNRWNETAQRKVVNQILCVFFTLFASFWQKMGWNVRFEN